MSNKPMDFSALARSQNVEQAVAGIKDLSVVLSMLHRELIENGFTRDEAMVLVVEYHRRLLGIATIQE